MQELADFASAWQNETWSCVPPAVYLPYIYKYMLARALLVLIVLCVCVVWIERRQGGQVAIEGSR